MWLSKFLSVEGRSVCTHEATEFSGSAEEFWFNADIYGSGADIYGNSDSANIYVLPSLLSERPLTRVVWIERALEEVARSMKAINMPFNQSGLDNLKMMHERNAGYFDLVVNFDVLKHPQICRMIWSFCLPGVPWDLERWKSFDQLKICYDKEHPMPEKNFDKFLAWVQRDIDESRKECA
jgi:hypothetical protein